jgi:hypothetical protein
MRSRLTCLALALALVAPVSAQLDNVGNLSFPTSGSPKAQQHFLRGVAILHSFGWKQAIAEFKLAQQAEPNFAMAYWGETLCYNHPLMGEQDAKNPRAILARLGPNTEARLAKAPTAREKGFLGAVEALWADGPDWRARRIAYKDAMERLHTQFPNDDEVTTFYALSLLSAARATSDETYRPEMKAGALATSVFKRNPKHPGAVHYIIHSFDDPVHAPLALEAAKVYAEIVPAVSHAVHMPTHIFIQHGMWNEVAHQNVRAFNIARDLWEPGDVPGDMAHSGDWGQYGFLQLGDYAGARERMKVFGEMAEKTKHPRAVSALALQQARYIIETEEWKVGPVAENASNETILANGFSAVKTGDMETAKKMEALLSAKAGGPPAPSATANLHADHTAPGAPAAPSAPAAPGPGGPDAGKSVRIMHRELMALMALAQGRKDDAVTLLKGAVAIEDSMRPPNGAADPIKPSHELLGEVLLDVGKPAEAAAAFDTSLLRMPNRARSLIGSARAHAAAGHREIAAERYQLLNSFWKGKPFSNPTTDAR